MARDDQQPEGDGDIRISRDMILLLGALSFLILARFEPWLAAPPHYAPLG